MLWKNSRRSDNIEDRRGMGASKKVVGGGLGTIVLVLAALFFGFDPSAFLNQNAAPAQQESYPGTKTVSAQEQQKADFISVVLADTEDVWNKLFQQMGKRYQEPKLVLFSAQVQSACGFASAAAGPFYCPGDHKVYIDLEFFNELKKRHNAPGDFAQAYVLAHEIGHHVQNLLGITSQVQKMQARSSETQANQLSVKLELQADCLAGVWAHHGHQDRQILERGDIDEALQAAFSIGDDTLQKQSMGYIVPDSFTHGTSKERMSWFRQGLISGNINSCNTF